MDIELQSQIFGGISVGLIVLFLTSLGEAGAFGEPNMILKSWPGNWVGRFLRWHGGLLIRLSAGLDRVAKVLEIPYLDFWMRWRMKRAVDRLAPQNKEVMNWHWELEIPRGGWLADFSQWPFQLGILITIFILFFGATWIWNFLFWWWVPLAVLLLYLSFFLVGWFIN